MSRAFLVVMDSVGIGGAPDAAPVLQWQDIPDTGANTLAHIAQACADGAMPKKGDRGFVTFAKSRCPRNRCGRTCVWRQATRRSWAGSRRRVVCGAVHGNILRVRIRPRGIGNWQVCQCRGTGIIFPTRSRPFPSRSKPGRRRKPPGPNGILGDCHASGTAIIAELGAEHMRSRPAHLLYLGRQRVPDCGARSRASVSTDCSSMCKALAPQTA